MQAKFDVSDPVLPEKLWQDMKLVRVVVIILRHQKHYIADTILNAWI